MRRVFFHTFFQAFPTVFMIMDYIEKKTLSPLVLDLISPSSVILIRS